MVIFEIEYKRPVFILKRFLKFKFFKTRSPANANVNTLGYVFLAGNVICKM